MAKTYDTYKDSGIAWIGEIPSEWEVVRQKNVFTLGKELIGDNWATTQLLSLTTKGIKCISIGNTSGKVPDSYNTYQTVKPNNLVMCLFDLDCSAVFSGISSCSGMISPAYKVLTVNEGADPRYYSYWFDFIFDGRKYMYLSKNIRYSLTYDEFAALGIVYPSLSEQQSIATFLDTKCVEIDALISLQEEMISELQAYKQSVITEAVTKGLNPHAKMKDSGVEWIGEIPEGWAVCSTKHLFNLYSGATPKTDNDSFWDGNIPWITPADFKTEDVYISKGRRNITQNGVDSCGTTIVPANSVIFSKRAPIGLVVLNKEPLCTNQGCISCVPKETFSKYYYYAMSVFTDSYELYGAGTTFMEISATSFANFKLPNPSFEEQHSIATYLDEKTSQIDSLIALKQEKIQELKDYKKSIIYEYVTGKKKV